MPKTGRRLHALKRPKLRQSWNKYNLYNLSRLKDLKIGYSDRQTFFQQKWIAKGVLRAYHGEHVKERDWERMFSRRLLSTVDMDPKYMAQFDGSEKAAGRGSGKEEAPPWNAKSIPKNETTPYMNMMFAPMERRLDIAVFRAMFASSARQARQFCIHGAVKVNGKKMPFPAYKLNPGDMFQVDPEKVLYATGAYKPSEAAMKSKKNAVTEASSEPAETETADEIETIEASAEEGAEVEATAEQDPDTTDQPEATPTDMKPTRKAIMELVNQARAVLAEEKLNVARKRELREFIKRSKPLLTKAGRPSSSAKEIATELNNMLGDLNLSEPASEGDVSAEASDNGASKLESLDELSSEELEALERRIAQEEENPRDSSKPYATPWRPRPFLSPFAFIPRYLEVNPKICSAVYLRHPVARRGSAEVPTPFGYRYQQLAFNWYLRRR